MGPWMIYKLLTLFGEYDLLIKTIFKSIGVIRVVTTTIIIMGVKYCLDSSPSTAPLLAMIRATSPLDTIPIPI